MRFLSAIVSSFLIILVFFSVSIPQISCSKTVTVHDTTIDTLYNLNYGLVAYYNFNKGNLNDSSGHGNNIVVNTAVATSDRFGRDSNAFQFSGGAYMKVANSTSLNPSQITMMAIVKFTGFYTGPDVGNQIFMKGYSDQTQGIYGLRVHPMSYDPVPLDTTTEMFTGFYGDNANAGIADSSFLIHQGNWNTVIYTYDGFVTKLYINGVLKKTRIAPFDYNVNPYDLYIGKTENPSFPYNFTGAIDEIRIYSKALSPFLIGKLGALTE